MVGVEIRALGPLAIVRADGSQVPIPSASQRRLLIALVVDAGSPVPISRLADRMALSADAVRVVVSRLRRTLGDGGRDPLILTEPPGYSIRADAVDLVRFDRLLRAADRSGNLEDRRRALEDAVGLWRGPPMLEFGSEPWVRGSAAKLVERYGGACEDLARTLLSMGRAATAVVVAAALTDAFPLREAGWSVLMQGLAKTGRRAEALRAFQTYRLLLAEQTGLSPGEALRDLERTIACS
jgi:DNA-binding SARP family transcriptional activator